MADARDDLAGITVGELRERLAAFPDAAPITFGSTLAGDPLIFYRVKDKSPRPTGNTPVPPKDMVVLIELSEGHGESP